MSSLQTSDHIHHQDAPRDADLSAWLAWRTARCDMKVHEISWQSSEQWSLDQGRFRHRTGGFFSVTGVALYRQGRHVPALDQPLIDQPEIGILGFVVADAEDGKHILIQGKPEPGNVHLVQAAPTVQATESNYKRRHLGKATPLLAHFLEDSGAHRLSDSLQSEQGTRFLGKYNRNVLLEVAGTDVHADDDTLRWFPLQTVLDQLGQDFLVNTDARSVLATSPWAYLATNGSPFSRWARQAPDTLGAMLWHSYSAPEENAALTREAIMSRLAASRARWAFETRPIALPELSGWDINEMGICSANNHAFSIRHYAVTTSEREVTQWDQPLAASRYEGQCVLYAQIRNGVLHFLFCASAEIGFREGVQFGPSLQDLGDEACIYDALDEQAARLRQHLGRAQVLATCLHSDEGGRFFRCVSRYSICLLDPGERIEEGPDLAWMTAAQIESLLRYPGVFSNEARSVISMLLAYV